jgi:hypothetical protein
MGSHHFFFNFLVYSPCPSLAFLAAPSTRLLAAKEAGAAHCPTARRTYIGSTSGEEPSLYTGPSVRVGLAALSLCLTKHLTLAEHDGKPRLLGFSHASIYAALVLLAAGS